MPDYSVGIFIKRQKIKELTNNKCSFQFIWQLSFNTTEKFYLSDNENK
jgi:hypothetical protein